MIAEFGGEYYVGRIFGVKKQNYIEKGEENFYFPLASSSEYKKYWVSAVEENNIKLVRDCNVFCGNQLDAAIEELLILLKWCDENISDGYQELMHYKITELLERLSMETKDSFDHFSVG